MITPAETAFQARTDLISEYGDNARLLFALQLRYDIDDVESVAATALVDGPDDKGCDLVFVDRSRGVVIIAQGYECRSDKPVAKSKKADDLNTAIAWLFQRPIPELPERLRSAAHEVREAIGSSDINAVEFWYVHNLPESANVKTALDTVRLTARNVLEQTFGSDRLPERIDAVEVGLGAQDEWYKSLEVHILVNDPFKLTVSGAFEIAGTGWKAVVTAVKAAWLHEIYLQHREKLFSANYREYLGVKMKRSRNEINMGIQHTAREDAGNFWVYNNGISAIVADYTLGTGASLGSLSVTGLSIVNGAQTTGAIGNLTTRPSDDALVPNSLHQVQR